MTFERTMDVRTITITYDYSGDEAAWEALTDAFVRALDGDPETGGKFTYQIAVADNGASRVHWGRWDSAETLAHVQSQPYFKAFASGLKDLLGAAPQTLGANVVKKTRGW